MKPSFPSFFSSTFSKSTVAPDNSNSSMSMQTSISSSQPQVTKTFGRKNSQTNPRGVSSAPLVNPFGIENTLPTVRNQETNGRPFASSARPIKMNIDDGSNQSEESERFNSSSQESYQSKASKKRVTEIESEPKNSRQRRSPPDYGGHSRSASGSTPTFELSSSVSSAGSTTTSNTRGSKNKTKTKGKKHYTSCLLQAEPEDVNHLRSLIGNNVNFTPCIFLPVDWSDFVRERYRTFIENLGFVRDKRDAYYFSNDDLDELMQALQSREEPSGIPLERTRSKSMQANTSRIDATFNSSSYITLQENRERATSCGVPLMIETRYERQESEDGSDCGTPRSVYTVVSTDDLSVASAPGRSSTPLGENFLLVFDKFNLNSAISPRYPLAQGGVEKTFSRSGTVSSHTMTEKISLGANHKRSTSKGTDSFLSPGMKDVNSAHPPQPPPSIAYPPLSPASQTAGPAHFLGAAVGIASGKVNQFPFMSNAILVPAAPVSLLDSGEVPPTPEQPLACSPSKGILSAFSSIPKRSSGPRKSFPNTSFIGNIMEASPALFNLQKNSNLENFVTPQGKYFCVVKWRESKPTEVSCIDHLRKKLHEKTLRLQRSELSLSSSSSVSSLPLATPLKTNRIDELNYQNFGFYRPPSDTVPSSSTSLAQQQQLSQFPHSFEEISRSTSLDPAGGYKLSYDHKQDLLQRQSSSEFQLLNNFMPPSIAVERGGVGVGPISSVAISLLNNSQISLNSSSASPRNHLLGESVMNVHHMDNSIYISDEEAQHYPQFNPSLMSKSSDSAFLNGSIILPQEHTDGKMMLLDEEIDLLEASDTFVYHSPGFTFRRADRSSHRKNSFPSKVYSRLSKIKLSKARRQSLHPINEKSKLELSQLSSGFFVSEEATADTPESVRSSMSNRALSPISSSQSPMDEIHHVQNLSDVNKSFQVEQDEIRVLSPSLKGSLASAGLQMTVFTPLLRSFLLSLCAHFSNDELLDQLSGINKLFHLYSLQTIMKRKDIGNLMLRAQNRRGVAPSARLLQWKELSNYLSFHRTGWFLGEGACKRVFYVKHFQENLEKALSIMDIDDLIVRGMECAIAKEIEITLLCSSLMKYRICPQMIRVYNIFQTLFDPSRKLWSNKPLARSSNSNAEFMKSSSSWSSLSSGSINTLECFPSQSPAAMIEKKHCNKGFFQFIEMEYCSCGDLESYIRSIILPSLQMIKSCLFQMVYSMYCGRVIFTLRHYDVKLLNFFVYKIPAFAPPQQAGSSSRFNLPQPVSAISSDYDMIIKQEAMMVGFDNLIFRIPFLHEYHHSSGNTNERFFLLVKLGDYGTGIIDNPLNAPITVQQFTTLENSPPEFLLLGEKNSQDYSSDTYNLGLSFFHLLTGESPYEELLKEVHCPTYLSDRWTKIWKEDSVIMEVIESLIPEEDDDDTEDIDGEDDDDAMEEGEGDDNYHEKRGENTPEEENPFLIFADTLYRFLVLFSDSPTFSAGFKENALYANTPIWKVIMDTFSLHSVRQRQNKHRDVCQQQFAKDVKIWSFHSGSHHIMERTRRRVQELGNGALQLLDSLLHWNPNQRCTMYEALKSPLFYSFCVDDPFLVNERNNPAIFDYFLKKNEYDRIPIV